MSLLTVKKKEKNAKMAHLLGWALSNFMHVK